MDHLIVRQADVTAKLEKRSHPLNSKVERHTVSLGDLTGLKLCGLHYTVLESGREATVTHHHQFADEFIFILSGQGELRLDGKPYALSAGDFAGLPARGPAHTLFNPGPDDLVYLVGGNRPEFDVCDYPQLGQRVYFYSTEKRHLDFVSTEEINAGLK